MLRVGKAFSRNIVNLSSGDFAAVKEAVKEGRVIAGPDIKDFEDLFATYIGTKHSVCVSSARAGLMFLIKALDLKPQDEVILPAYTFHVVPAIVKSMGLKPAFADVRTDTYNIDVSKIKEKLTSRTRLILATHILGQPCQIDEIMDLSKRYNIKVIEDCAHSCGAEYKGRKVGSFGDCGIFSFGMGKLMNCLGGGIITCNNEELKDRLQNLIRSYSDLPRKELVKRIARYASFYLFTHPRFFPYSGYLIIRAAGLFGKDILDRLVYEPVELYERFSPSFYRKFSNLQAMIGIRQLRHLDEKIDRIIKNVRVYNEELSGAKGLITPFVLPEAKSTYLYYRIRVEDREGLKERLLRDGVDTKIDDIAVCPGLEIFSGTGSDYPAAEEISRTSLELPCYFSLSEDDVRQIAIRLRKALHRP